MLRCCLLLLLLLPVGLTAQDTTQQVLGEIEAALRGGDYQSAAQQLDTLEVISGGLPVNGYLAQGNAYYEVGDYGRAILAYERGLRLRPGHTDLRNNLAYVREEAGITEPPLPDFLLLRWWRVGGAALGATTAYVLALVWWWLAVAGALWWFLFRKTMAEQRRFALLPAAGLCLLLAIACYALGHHREAYLGQSDEAVLLAVVADLRVSPTPEASVEATLTGGLRLRITDRVGDYVKVLLADGRQGYLRATEIAVI